MKHLAVIEFLSLDGVMQAPGAPDEDLEGGFAHGGWQREYFDEVLGAEAARGMALTDTYLFGRKTYEMMARFWPDAPADDPFAASLNGLPKYVASRGRPELTWANSSLLEGDVAAAVTALKQGDGGRIAVLGSGELVRSLLAHDLVDELSLTISPLLIGSGKKLFGDSDELRKLTLTDCVRTTSGSVLLTYHRP